MFDRALASREHRRLRSRRRRRRAYIRSVYLLPSLATLGNAVCGFGAMYVASLVDDRIVPKDAITQMLVKHGFAAAAGLIFLSMLFDALDGRLARYTRHTTDFGGQLDSMADVVSFGAAPAFIALQLTHYEFPDLWVPVSRLIWAIGALYFSCACVRLARFNVSNEHGEQHHFSFLGLPSPGAAGAVAAWILMQQDLAPHTRAAQISLAFLPILLLATGLLMVSNIRYPHLVNRYMRGKKSVATLMTAVVLALMFVVWPRQTLALGTAAYAFYGFALWVLARARKSRPAPKAG